MRRRTLTSNDIVGKKDAVAGDILCAKEDGSKMVFKAADYASIPNSGYTPIGIVVVPPSHDVYGTGEGSAICLNYISPDTPGVDSLKPTRMELDHSVPESMIWENPAIPYGAIIAHNATLDGMELCPPSQPSSLHPIHSQMLVPDYGELAVAQNSYQATNGYGQVVFNNLGRIYTAYGPPSCINNYYHDSKIHYHSDDMDSYFQYCVLSPYNQDESRSSLFLTPTAEYYGYALDNICCDFNGKENTENIISLQTDNSWKTASTIPNSEAFGTTASCTAWRYRTVGTAEGDWYIPAFGEMCYYSSRWYDILSSIDKLCPNYNISTTNTWSRDIFYPTSTYVRNVTYLSDIGRYQGEHHHYVDWIYNFTVQEDGWYVAFTRF